MSEAVLSKAIPESDNDRANYVTLVGGGVNFCHPRRAIIIPDAYASRLLRIACFPRK
jgi:hypothetical protein